MSLIEIISATQIMDPRMDIGFGRSRKPNPDDDPPFDANQTLSPSEIMMIIDILLAYEVTWYSGRLLSQTILTSNYLRHLDQLKHHSDPLIKHVLRSYLLGLIKCCSIVSDEISKCHLRENEDVHIECQINDFIQNIDVTQTLYELDHAHAILNVWPNEIEGYRMPLMERIRFRIEYLCTLDLLSSSPTTSTIPQLEIHILSASEALQCIKSYSNSDKSISLSDQSHRVKSSFNLNFIQTVSSHSPPRPIDFPKSLHDLILMTRKILEDLLSITQIGLVSSIPDFMTFFHGFSRQDPMPFPFVRSYFLSLFQDGNVVALNQSHTLDWLARECIFNLSAGRIRIESNGVEIRYILNRLAGLIVNYLSAFAANRSRGRRMLTNSLIEWKSLYRATSFKPLGISPLMLQVIQTLMYYFSIESGLQIILMGFDLELYEHHHDRISMWWVVERLSQRSSQLLKILSGGVESLEVNMMDIIRKLAGAASQIARPKGEANRENLTNQRTIFKRRTKWLTGLEASFECTDLIDELGLTRDLLDYQQMVQTQFIDTNQLTSTLENVLHQLVKISAQAHLHRKIGLHQFQFFIHTLTNATQDLISKNSRDQDEGVSIGKLKISHTKYTFDDEFLKNNDVDDDDDDDGDDRIKNQNQKLLQPRLNTFNQKIYFIDASSRWFLLT